MKRQHTEWDKIASVDKDVEESEPSYTADRNIKWCGASKTVW